MSNSNFKVETGKFGERLVLTSAWQPHYLVELSGYHIAEIDLNTAKGWVSTSLEFLLLFPHIKALTIVDWDIDDISLIIKLKNLQYLKLNVFCKIEFDLSIFSELESCVVEWTKGMESIFSCKQLKHVFINKLPEHNFGRFSGFYQLESLSLKSPNLHTLDGVSELKKLKFLGIYQAVKLQTLAGLERLRQLTRLEIDTCKKIVRIDALGALIGLKVLHLSNQKELASLSPLRDLPELEEVMLLESTNIVDGDLSFLKTLPKLKKLFFVLRRHYSLKPLDFPQYS